VLSASTKAQVAALLPNVIAIDGFGSTETGVSGSRARMPGAEVEEGTRFTLDDHSAVLDEGMRPVAPGSGVVGRLARRGRVPLGYYNDPATTAATFVSVDGVRWALTGDAATVDADGTIVLLGRGSMSINSGGEKVYPEEVEEALKLHPTVADAAVVGVPDERFGEAITALVEPHAGDIIDEAALVAHVKERLAHYKAPKRVLTIATVGRAANGKLDYKRLTAEAMERLGLS
jgi:acyl-CoA synthetase (AMP-forming)/AMP-acid ligase II